MAVHATAVRSNSKFSLSLYGQHLFSPLISACNSININYFYTLLHTNESAGHVHLASSKFQGGFHGFLVPMVT